jgi:hypothetical protein
VIQAAFHRQFRDGKSAARGLSIVDRHYAAVTPRISLAFSRKTLHLSNLFPTLTPVPIRNVPEKTGGFSRLASM